MTRYLCISVTFLDPLFHGEADGGLPEWPPSPLRLFQALVAGAFTGAAKLQQPELKAEAFRWLEALGPPEIVTPRTHPAASYILFVPNNDSDRKFDRHERLTSKLVRPTRLLDGQTLHYLWPLPDSQAGNLPQADCLNLLCRSARQMLALGWGIDLVVADGQILTSPQLAALPGERWVPSPGPWLECRRRVPKPGTFDNLLRVYDSFIHSVQGKLFRRPEHVRVFHVAAYRKVSSMLSRHCAAFDFRDRRGLWRSFPQTHVVQVAAMLRHQACEAAKRDSHCFEGGPELYVAGHVSQSDFSPPRFSYLPLPTIRPGQHADGMIRRALIAEPYGGDGSHAAWAQARLSNALLVNTKQQVQAILLPRRPEDTVYPFYLSRSRSWATVTPIALPGYDDGKHGKAERLFLKALQQAGLPLEALEEFTLRKAPFWPGSHHPSVYYRPQDYLKRCPLWHVYLRFKEEIPGPVAIGAGRHCGLGLFASMDAFPPRS